MSPVLQETSDNQTVVQTAELERENLDIVKQCRLSEDLVEYEAFSHSSPSEKAHSLTCTTLRGAGMIVLPPLMFYNKTYSELTTILHLGTNICGHDGIIHGGLAATILDDVLGYVAIPALPNMMGFTANLNVNYRRPITSDQWVVARAKVDKVEERKAYVSASIENLEGQILTEATSLYISPRK
ncbi:Thioesterase/thiol ester dehydrase-isomerase, partial [Backusella circina FSU 941]